MTSLQDSDVSSRDGKPPSFSSSSPDGNRKTISKPSPPPHPTSHHLDHYVTCQGPISLLSPRTSPRTSAAWQMESAAMDHRQAVSLLPLLLDWPPQPIPTPIPSTSTPLKVSADDRIEPPRRQRA
ncbi:unnamed protein product [Phytophthora lilii]|uniref:Unnamed protein product n=1 Tax=Phytophthora lilii TaxID=2077276 RepID=A0A9W6TGY1_9STRA|nr:unnamed protein product [Phytophthora lilii]